MAHDNLGAVFVTGPNLKPKVLLYEQSEDQSYYLPIPKRPDESIEEYTAVYPVEPYDAFQWF